VLLLEVQPRPSSFLNLVGFNRLHQLPNSRISPPGPGMSPPGPEISRLGMEFTPWQLPNSGISPPGPGISPPGPGISPSGPEFTGSCQTRVWQLPKKFGSCQSFFGSCQTRGFRIPLIQSLGPDSVSRGSNFDPRPATNQVIPNPLDRESEPKLRIKGIQF
jgi:hypothetical protein